MDARLDYLSNPLALKIIKHVSAPSTRISGGPSPTLSYAMIVPSCELTLSTVVSSGVASGSA